MISHPLYGSRNGVVSSPNPVDAIGLALRVGPKTVRPPIGPGNIAAKFANGAVVESLTEIERRHLDILGVRIEQVMVTAADRNKIMNDGIAAGQDRQMATLAAQTAKGGWRSVEPVSVETYFVPAK